MKDKKTANGFSYYLPQEGQLHGREIYLAYYIVLSTSTKLISLSAQ